MFNPIHSISDLELFKKHLCSLCILKEMVPLVPVISIIVCIHYALLLAVFNLLHSSTNQKLFEKHLCNQNSHYKNMDDFHYKGKPSRAISKLTLFAVSKDEWDTKEDAGKSMKNALYILWYAKGTPWAEVTSNSEKIKPIVLAVIELRLSEGISQS